MAGHARTIGVLTPCCDDDDVDLKCTAVCSPIGDE